MDGEHDDLYALARKWRRHASDLRKEVENGVALRQSLESKRARVDVLESCAEQLETLAGELR